MKISPQALRATRKTSVPKRILWSKIEGLILAFWRLGGGGREDVVIVTKFNPFLFFRAKLASFCHSQERRLQGVLENTADPS